MYMFIHNTYIYIYICTYCYCYLCLLFLARGLLPSGDSPHSSGGWKWALLRPRDSKRDKTLIPPMYRIVWCTIAAMLLAAIFFVFCLWSGGNFPVWSSGGRRPLSAGCFSLQRTRNP